MQFFEFGTAPRAKDLGYALVNTVIATEKQLMEQHHAEDVIFVYGAAVQSMPNHFEFARFERVPGQASTKLLQVRLSAHRRVEHLEVVRVPFDISAAEVLDLVNLRFAAVDGTRYTDDPDYWQRSTCEALPMDTPNATASLYVVRTATGIRVDPLPAH